MLVQSVSLFSNSGNCKKTKLNNQSVPFGAKQGWLAKLFDTTDIEKGRKAEEHIAQNLRKAFPGEEIPDPKDCQPSKPYHIERAEEDFGR